MMFSVQKVQNFPAARAKSDAKGKKTIDFYLAPKIFTQNVNFFYTTFRRKNTA